MKGRRFVATLAHIYPWAEAEADADKGFPGWGKVKHPGR